MMFALLGWVLRGPLTERRLIAEFGADLYLPEEIANATRYYVRPDATSVDLAQEMEEGTNVVATREDLFDAVERFIDEESDYRHLLLLADAGMGKSSFVLNYYDYNRRKWRKRYKLAVIPLGHRKALEKIKQIERPNETILFLDAFDEDPGAREDYKARLDELMEAACEFRRVLITCRTQFFPKDASIPRAAGMVFAPRTGGAQHSFGRLYLAPFSDRQVDAFLRRRYWPWSLDKKRRAREFARKVPKLTVRPMLLTHIPDLLQTQAQINTSWELYEVLTDRWCARERGFWEETEDLRKFSEEVAVHFYLSFLEQGADRVPRGAVTRIVADLKVSIADLDEWKATSRSLLHRDAEGNWKFAHRSIMEFLFLKRFFAGDERCRGVAWTDQMKKFVLEISRLRFLPKFSALGGLVGADLTGVDIASRGFIKTDFAGADLGRANLRAAQLQNSNLTATNLTGAKLELAVLTRADLTGAKFNGADLRGAHLVDVNLNNADLTGAQLEGANFKGSDLSGARFDRENIADAVRGGARLLEVNLRDAELEGVTLAGVVLSRANLRGAKLRHANLIGAKLNEADLAWADLSRATLGRAKMYRVILDGANLGGANLGGADLSVASLKEADLTGAKLTLAVLSRADLKRANLNGADLTGANLEGARLEGADLSGADLTDAISVSASEIRMAKLNQDTKLPRYLV